MTAMRVVSNWHATSPTLHPGSLLTMSRILRRVALPSASNTVPISSIGNINITC